MKNELELLLEKVQKEYDSLEKEMKLCIDEWDFIGAESYRKPLIYTKQRLRVLRNLKNPDYHKITHLKQQIKRTKILKYEYQFDQRTNRTLGEKLLKYESELAELQAKKPEFKIDDDNIATNLEDLLSGKNEKLEIALIQNELSIKFQIQDSVLTATIQTHGRAKISDYLGYQYGIAELKGMGFAMSETGEAIKKISAIKPIKICDIIETVARITYDVFGLYTNE